MDLKNTLIVAAGAVLVALVLLLIVAAPGFLEAAHQAALHGNLLAGTFE